MRLRFIRNMGRGLHTALDYAGRPVDRSLDNLALRIMIAFA